MGREIAKCLRGPARNGDGFIETAEGIVTWGFGHILRQAEPEEYEERYHSWRAEDLPIVPAAWKLVVAESSAKQFGIVKRLIAQADEIVHAGDPDREGQLLIDEVLDFVGNTKPVLRILLNALDEKSIKEANADLRDNRSFLPLKNSALARARADWLIGMNLSRAYTLAARRAGHEVTLPVGRVKTPTLALVVRRERELKDFKPQTYYTLKADFLHDKSGGTFTAQWKPGELQAGLDSEGRLTDKAEAERLLARLSEEPLAGKIASYQKAKKEEPQRLPFALSSLQVLAGRRFGYDPQLVLDTAQSLYEKKLTTYPRSDAEYLPLNQLPAAKSIVGNLAAIDDSRLADWAKGADLSIKSRAWNDKKITAHHAIIPTTVRVNLSKLTETERNIYFLVAQAYLAQFYPVHIYEQTRVGVEYKEEQFTASGRVVKQWGWKELYRAKSRAEVEADAEENEKDKDEAAELPPMKKNDAVTYRDGRAEEKKTKPPTRFTPATLLQGMKEIHKYVKNPEMKKQLRDVYGIGTEATRATIIDDLIRRKFLLTQGKKKYLIPTDEAYLLIDALPDELTYPDSTAVWEDRLHSMAEGEGSVEEFLQAQIELTELLCGKAADARLATPEASGFVKCPRCGRGVLRLREGKRGAFWGCSDYPRCRMACDDKDGAPDVAAWQAKQRNVGTEAFAREFGGSGVVSSASFGGGRGYGAPRRNAAGGAQSRRAQQTGSAAPKQDFYSPYLSEEEMREFSREYQPVLSVTSSSYGAPRKSFTPGWGDKPKYSAAPLEDMEKSAEPSPVTDAEFTCPDCKEGKLKRVHGRNGVFWACDRYPYCIATYDDKAGLPVI